MDKEQKINDIIDIFFDISTQIILMEKDTRDFGTGDLLTPVEIKTVVFIYNNPDANVTKISQKNHVTKGAVSQIILKLEKKDLITRYKKDDNAKEVYFKVNEKGLVAVEGHAEYHNEVVAMIMDDFINLPDDKIDFLKETFQKIHGYFESFSYTDNL